ncbi:MAG: succinate dehydrogenase, cytochrome b556 subunit [Rhodospirillales bacterium]|jgi:succinate dehydrogenase / fumarate reductase cytochrome b subunit
MASGNRPLSPHLQIYRPQITSMLSILHRMTGVALAVGAVLLTYWLTSAAYGPEQFGRAQEFMGTPIGRLILLGTTISFFYHMANGIRHLAWDVGWGFELPKLRATGYLVLIVTVGLTLLVWFSAYSVRG